MKTQQNQQFSEELVTIATENEFLTIEQASKFLGYKIKTLYKKNSQGEIPYYNPTGGKVLYLKRELEEWIKNGRQKSGQGMEQFINYLTKKAA
ncbi:helix-turn-helix domain-containing protein [Chryseobacterium soli]|uniref:helix-turn-helix domain-containing protein n=1 Tax=Chryseobacterium soli TaxID=445961 RepID=UPI000690619E|nr:helix-turn-helix domain-containing protein [Chryseobacterium soli]